MKLVGIDSKRLPNNVDAELKHMQTPSRLTDKKKKRISLAVRFYGLLFGYFIFIHVVVQLTQFNSPDSRAQPHLLLSLNRLPFDIECESNLCYATMAIDVSKKFHWVKNAWY